MRVRTIGNTSNQKQIPMELSHFLARLRELYKHHKSQWLDNSSTEYTEPYIFDVSKGYETFHRYSDEHFIFNTEEYSNYIDSNSLNLNNDVLSGQYHQTAIIAEDSASNELYFDHLSRKHMETENKDPEIIILRVDLRSLLKNSRILNKSVDDILAYTITNHAIYQKQISEDSLKNFINHYQNKICLLIEGIEDVGELLQSNQQAQDLLKLTKNFNYIVSLNSYPKNPLIAEHATVLLYNYGYSTTQINNFINLNYRKTNYLENNKPNDLDEIADDIVILINENKFLIELSRHPLALDILASTIHKFLNSNYPLINSETTTNLLLQELVVSINQKSKSYSLASSANMLMMTFLKRISFEILAEGKLSIENIKNDPLVSIENIYNFNKIFPLFKITTDENNNQIIKLNELYRIAFASHHVIDSIKKNDFEPLKQSLQLAVNSEIHLKLLKNIILTANEDYKRNNNDKIIDILEYVEKYFNNKINLTSLDKELLIKLSLCSALANSGNDGYITEYFKKLTKEIDRIIITNLVEFKDIIIKLKYHSPELIDNLTGVITNKDSSNQKALAIEILSKIEITNFIQRSNIANKLISIAQNYVKDPNLAITAIDNLQYFRDLSQVKRFFIESISSSNIITALASIEYLASIPKASNLEILKTKLLTENEVIYVSALKAIKKIEYLIDNKANFAYELLERLTKSDISPSSPIYSETFHFLSPYKNEIQKQALEYLNSCLITNIDENRLETIEILLKNNFFEASALQEIVETIDKKLDKLNVFFSPFSKLNTYLIYFKCLAKTLDTVYPIADETLRHKISEKVIEKVKLVFKKKDHELFIKVFIKNAEAIITANINEFYGLLIKKNSANNHSHITSEEKELLIQINKILSLSYNSLSRENKNDLYNKLKDSFILNLHNQSKDINTSYLIILKQALENQDNQTIRSFLKELSSYNQLIGVDSNYLNLLHKFGNKQEIVNYHHFVFDEQNRSIFSTEKIKLSIAQEIPRLIQSTREDVTDYLKTLIVLVTNSNSTELTIQAIKSFKQIFQYVDGNKQKEVSHILLEMIDKNAHKEVKLEILSFINMHHDSINKHNSEIFDKFHAAILNEKDKTVLNELHSHLKRLKQDEKRQINFDTHINAFKGIINDSNSPLDNRISSIHLMAKFIEDFSLNNNSDDNATQLKEDLSLFLINLISSEKNYIIKSHSVRAINEIYKYLNFEMKYKLINALNSHGVNDDDNLNLAIKLLNDKFPRIAQIENVNFINIRSALDELENKFIDYINLNRLEQSKSRFINDIEYNAINQVYRNNILDKNEIELILNNKELITHKILTTNKPYIKAAYLKLLINLSKEQLELIEFIFRAHLLKSRSASDLNATINDLITILDNHPNNDLAIGLKKYLENNLKSFQEIITQNENQLLLFEGLKLQNNHNHQAQKSLALYKPDDQAPQFTNNEHYLELPKFYRRHSDSLTIKTSDLFSPIVFERSRSNTDTQKIETIFDIEAPRISFTPSPKNEYTLNSNLLVFGGLMKFSEIWESTKFLLNKYIPIIPLLEKYNLLPNYNYETQHYIVSSLYTLGAVSLGAVINVNPVLVGFSVSLFWLKPCIYQSKNQMLDYIDTQYGLTGISRDYLDLALETGINFGTSLPFININSFLAAPTIEKGYFILPMISQAALSVLSNKIHYYNDKSTSDSYITQIVPKIATSVVLFYPLIAPHNTMTEILLSKFSNEIKVVFITANSISSAHLTYVSTEYFLKSLEEYFYPNEEVIEDKNLIIGESLLTE